MAHKSDKSESNDSRDVPANFASGDAGAAAAQGQTEGDPVEDQIRKLTAEKDELRDTLLRRQADFDNYRKRVEKERHQERHRGVEDVIKALLPVLDAFDNALASAEKDSAAAEYVTGFELIRRQLWDLLSKQGLVRIESVGKEFNPHFHHAIDRVETTEQPDNTVVSELQPGYLFHERVVRPAMVRVAAEPAHLKREN